MRLGNTQLSCCMAAAILCTSIAATPKVLTDPWSSLGFLVGSWDCKAYPPHVLTSPPESYRTTFAFDMGGRWLHETDSYSRWMGAMYSEALLTYDLEHHAFLLLMLESFNDHRLVKVLHSTAVDSSRVDYNSVYPDAGMSISFRIISATKYEQDTRWSSGPGDVTQATCVKM